MPFLNTISSHDFQSRKLKANRLAREIEEKHQADDAKFGFWLKVKIGACLLAATALGSFLFFAGLFSIMPE
jgi:hypothetical protein